MNLPTLVFPPSLLLIIGVYFGVIVAFIVWVKFFAPAPDYTPSDSTENQNQDFNLAKKLKDLETWT